MNNNYIMPDYLQQLNIFLYLFSVLKKNYQSNSFNFVSKED